MCVFLSILRKESLNTKVKGHYDSSELPEEFLLGVEINLAAGEFTLFHTISVILGRIHVTYCEIFHV
jgi:hypothetical protein